MRTCGPTEALVWIDERAGAGETVTASQLFCNRALCLLKLEPIRAAEALEDCNAAVVSPHLRRPLSARWQHSCTWSRQHAGGETVMLTAGGRCCCRNWTTSLPSPCIAAHVLGKL